MVREADVYREQIEGLSTLLEAQVAEIPDDLLYMRPGPSRNNAGFLYWHILRIWDLDLSFCKGTPLAEDAWHRGEYAAESGYNPDGLGLRGLGMGVGYTDAEVDAVAIGRRFLGDYQRQLLAETTAYLADADDAALRTPRPSPSNPNQQVTSAERLQHLIAHSYNHVGELRYVKGTLGFPDPSYPREQ
jgi:hypothetical protein